MEEIEVGPGIKLEQFLKYCGAYETGGSAKIEIQTGLVAVNGLTEIRRGRRLQNDDIIQAGGESYRVKVVE